MLRNLGRFAIVVPALAAWLGSTLPAGAQVVIDMPPPPKKAHQPVVIVPAATAVDPTTATTVTTSSSSTVMPSVYPVSMQEPEVGDIALYRYSEARFSTYDTYYNDGSYWSNGYHTYPRYYPQYVWGWPWFGWGFSPFHFHMGFHSCD